MSFFRSISQSIPRYSFIRQEFNGRLMNTVYLISLLSSTAIIVPPYLVPTPEYTRSFYFPLGGAIDFLVVKLEATLRAPVLSIRTT